MNIFDIEDDNPDSTYFFARNRETQKSIEIRELCEHLWLMFEPYADSNFLNELPLDFESRFWEMDLTCALLNHGYEISSKDEGPDVLIKSRNKRIWIEAVAPTNGKGPNKVRDNPQPTDPIKARSVPDEKLILRFTASIKEKFEKFENYRQKGIISSKEPYVIAINSLKLNCQTDYDNPPRIVRSVFPFGPFQVTYDTNTLESIDEGFEYKKAIINHNLKPVSIDMFLDSKYSNISAVLFSQADCLNRTKNITDSYVVVHNPLANNPIETNFFNFGVGYSAVQIGEKYQLHRTQYYS